MRYLYLHGFCSGPATFKGNYFRQRFAEYGIELQTPDLNSPNFEHLTISSQLAIVRNILRENQEPTTLIGSSMGGYLGCLMAQEAPSIARLVMIAPAIRFIERYLDLIGEEQATNWRKTGWIEVDHYQYGEKRRLHYGLIEDARQYENRELTRELPTWIFHGVFDDTVPYQNSIEYLSLNPQAELILFPSDHSLNAEIDRLWHYMKSEFI